MFFSKLRSTNYFSLLFKGVKRASIHMETKFQLRTEEQKLQAIGGYYDSNKKFHLQDQTRIPKSTNIAQLTAALDPSIFAPLPKPGPSDWLANHQEYGLIFSGNNSLMKDNHFQITLITLETKSETKDVERFIFAQWQEMKKI